MRLVTCFSGVLAVLIGIPAIANTYLVCPDGSGDFSTIQDAVDVAVDGDIIELCCDVTFSGNGNRDIDCSGRAITLRSVCGDPDRCIIDCAGSQSDPHRALDFHTGEGPETVVEGITIRNGHISVTEGNYPGDGGGGARCLDSSPTFRNCVFQENSCSGLWGFGGAVYCRNASPVIDGCTFETNSAHDGAAIFCGEGSDPIIEDGLFTHNSAEDDGGALFNYQSSSPQVGRTIFFENGAAHGGAVSCRHSCSPTFDQVTIYGCSGGQAAMFLDHDCEATITRTIVAFCQGTATFRCDDNSGISISCSDVYGNTGGDWVDCLAGQDGVSGNFSADPLFCAPESGDLTLMLGSTCLPGNHPDGNDCGQIGARPVGCGCDVLAYAQRVVEDERGWFGENCEDTEFGDAEAILGPPDCGLFGCAVSLGDGAGSYITLDMGIITEPCYIRLWQIGVGPLGEQETFSVWVSRDGVDYESLGVFNQAGSADILNVPAGVGPVRYVRLLQEDGIFPPPFDCASWGADFDAVALALPEEPLTVAFDIKPGSCPNPYNIRSRGVLPTAILGTDDFDVQSIDVETLLLHGAVLPLRSSIEDVGTPVHGEDCECTTDGADGFDDLVLHFDRRTLTEALGEVVDGEILEIGITGSTLDGRAIEGSDCIVILDRGRGEPPYNGKYDSGNLTLTWNPTGEDDITRYAVYRSSGQEMETAELVGHTTTETCGEVDCAGGAGCWYAITAWNAAGYESDASSPVWVGAVSDVAEIGAAPARFMLESPVPNPFNPITGITYGIPGGVTSFRVVMSIYDTDGRKVRTLIDADQGPGTYRAIWNGMDDGGAPVASGMYYCRLTWNGQKETRAVLLLK